jgi:hypothetical protein
MHPSIIIIVAVVAWAAAMLKLLPRAWRLDKERQRKRRAGAGKRLSIGELKLRSLRLEQAGL